MLEVNLKILLNTNKGFTLTEMIVTIVIIGILLSILVPGLFKYIEKTKDRQFMVNARSAYIAVQDNLLEAFGSSNIVTFIEVIADYQSKGAAGLTASDIEGIPETGKVIMDIKAMNDIGLTGNSIDENTGEILALEYREGNKYIQYVKAKGWTNVAVSP